MKYLSFFRTLCLACLFPYLGYAASKNSMEQKEKIEITDNQSENQKNDKDQGKEKEKETKGNVARGIKIWGRTCAGCHNMRDPKDFNDKGWEMIMMHMRVRAGLTGQDTRDVLEFLKRSN